MVLIVFSKSKPFLLTFLSLLQYKPLLLVHFSIKQCLSYMPIRQGDKKSDPLGKYIKKLILKEVLTGFRVSR